MPWNTGFSAEQEIAASHMGAPARLPAGPGTGKTRVLIQRIQYLIEERGVSPQKILALTFTRAAANELRQRLKTVLVDGESPNVSTLHSYALRQLLKNSHRLKALPQPLRVADDWEERYVILEDVKTLLKLGRIKEAKRLFNLLSSDWDTLAAEQGTYTCDPKFIGAWTEHRTVFGYTLRSELVYQLKRSLEQLPGFQLDPPVSHLLVDEYQDLNCCDLAVIEAIASRGAELFVAGDDDQSIYGFRMAHPDGIRNFPQVHHDAVDLLLRECKRCDEEILRLGEFVASLDLRRIDKGTKPELGRPQGEVRLLSFPDNDSEALSVAKLCKGLIENDKLPPHEILVLLRVDTHHAFSRPLQEAFARLAVPVAVDPAAILDADAGRQVLAFLRLLNRPDDHLSWVTLLSLRKNGVGPKAIAAVYEYARSRGLTFAQALSTIANTPSEIPKFGARLALEFKQIGDCLATLSTALMSDLGKLPVRDLLETVVSRILDKPAPEIIDYLLELADKTGAVALPDLLLSMEAVNIDAEPEIEPGKVNILTMHKAKGLTATAVVVIGVEDEHIPGRQDKEPALGDERRLLFVSLTRAKRMLFLTYCAQRLGQQSKLGKGSGKPDRTLSQFLHHAPIHPKDGVSYVRDRGTS